MQIKTKKEKEKSEKGNWRLKKAKRRRGREINRKKELEETKIRATEKLKKDWNMERNWGIRKTMREKGNKGKETK